MNLKYNNILNRLLVALSIGLLSFYAVSNEKMNPNHKKKSMTYEIERVAAQKFIKTIKSKYRQGKEKKLIDLLFSQYRISFHSIILNNYPIESSGSTLLHWAVIYNFPKLAQLIIDIHSSKLIVNKRDSFKRTPLMRAASNGSFEAAKVLISSGAQIDLLDNENNSAYTYATMTSSKSTETVRNRLIIGAAASVTGGIGAPVLHGAVKIIEVVTRESEEVTIVTDTVEQVLRPDLLCDHIGCCGHYKIAQLLKENGADITKKANTQNELNTFCNIITPERYVAKGLKSTINFFSIDNERL